MRRISLALIPLLLAACEPPAPKLAGSGMDMFAPTAIRLHGLTRFVPGQDSNGTLEARLEFADQFSDPTKGAGTVTLQLFDQPPLIHKGSQIASWTLPLTTPEQNRDHWDKTTRTYVFRLPLDKPLPTGRDHVLLTAALTLPNSAVLTFEAQVATK